MPDHEIDRRPHLAKIGSPGDAPVQKHCQNGRRYTQTEASALHTFLHDPLHGVVPDVGTLSYIALYIYLFRTILILWLVELRTHPLHKGMTYPSGCGGAACAVLLAL